MNTHTTMIMGMGMDMSMDMGMTLDMCPNMNITILLVSITITMMKKLNKFDEKKCFMHALVFLLPFSNVLKNESFRVGIQISD